MPKTIRATVIVTFEIPDDFELVEAADGRFCGIKAPDSESTKSAFREIRPLFAVEEEGIFYRVHTSENDMEEAGIEMLDYEDTFLEDITVEV